MFQLGNVLRLDAIASGGLGLLLVALANGLDEALGLASRLAVAIGAILIVWAGFVAFVVRAADRKPALVRIVVAVNVLWVIASVVFAIAERGPLTVLGVVVVLAQAATVAALAELQSLGLRRTAGTVASSTV